MSRTPDVKPAETTFPPEIIRAVDRWIKRGVKVRLTRDGDVILNDGETEGPDLDTMDWRR